jgi:hypothetical protein
MPLSKFFRKIGEDIGEDFAASALRTNKTSDDYKFSRSGDFVIG